MSKPSDPSGGEAALAEDQKSHGVTQPTRLGPMPPDFRVVRCKVSQLTFGVAPRDQTRALIDRVNPNGAPSNYLLEGMEGDQWAAREGRSIRIGARLPMHANNRRLDFYDRVAILAGPHLQSDHSKVVECWWARQLAHVGKVKHLSRGPEMPTVDASAWCAGGEAYLRSLIMAPILGITCLQPNTDDNIASIANVRAGFLERWSPDAIARRNSHFLKNRSDCDTLLEICWGDFISVAEYRDGHFWLLPGSQIRKTAVECAPKCHKRRRKQLASERRTTAVLGYPDRVMLTSDFCVGGSIAGLTQFTKGSADAGTRCWRKFTPEATRWPSNPSPSLTSL